MNKERYNKLTAGIEIVPRNATWKKFPIILSNLRAKEEPIVSKDMNYHRIDLLDLFPHESFP